MKKAKAAKKPAKMVKAAAEKRGPGRQSTATAEMKQKICLLIAEGESLRAIAKMEGMPSRQCVLKWLAQDTEFVAQYARAREEQADTLADEIIEIADDGTNDWMEKQGEEGQPPGYVLNGEHIQRSKLRVEARKWVASKLKPKKYGDSTTIKGDPSAPLGMVLIQSTPQDLKL